MTQPFIFKVGPERSDSLKATTINSYDWKHAFGGNSRDALTNYTAYLEVAWIRRCVELRSNALMGIPAKVYRGDNEIEYEYADLLPRLLWLTEAALQIYGAAYWGRKRNILGADRGYKWLLPTTIEPVLSVEQGLTGFKRRLPGREAIPIATEDLVYFWSPSLNAEVAPGNGWVRTVLTEAGIVYHTDEFASAFFERGAIPALVLSVDGSPPRAELDRLESWWRRMLSGVKNAFETVAVAAVVKPQVIGYPTKDLAMPELAALVRQQICAAAGVPQTMLEDAANYATAVEQHKTFYSETIIPEATMIMAALNEQVFRPQGLEVDLDWDSLDIFQEDESARAAALKQMTDAGIPLDLAMQMLGMDLPGQMTYDDLRARLERDKVNATPPQLLPFTGQASNPPSTAAELPETVTPTRAVSDDLDRWRRKALSSLKAGNVADVPFVSEVIPDSTAAVLHERLSVASTDEEVRAAFVPPFRVPTRSQYEGYP